MMPIGWCTPTEPGPYWPVLGLALAPRLDGLGGFILGHARSQRSRPGGTGSPPRGSPAQARPTWSEETEDLGAPTGKPHMRLDPRVGRSTTAWSRAQRDRRLSTSRAGGKATRRPSWLPLG